MFIVFNKIFQETETVVKCEISFNRLNYCLIKAN